MLARLGFLMVLGYGAAYAWLLDWGRPIPRDGSTLVVGRDFLNFWFAGVHAWEPEPGRYYDLQTYQQAMEPLVGPDYLGQVWSYPPAILLLAAPFAFLAYLPALLAWSVGGVVVFFLTLRRLASSRALIASAVLSPAALFGLISGQLHFLAAALMLGVLVLRQNRPWLAGALGGLFLFKPPIAIFLPLLLIAERNGRMIIAGALSALTIALCTAAIWGPGIWLDYWHVGIPTQGRVLADPLALPAPFMPTVFMNLRSAGASITFSWWGQGAAALIAAGLILTHFRSRPDARSWRDNAGFLAAAAFGTPYLMGYDTLPLVTAALLSNPTARAPRLLTLGCWLLVPLQMVLAPRGIPGPALIPAALAVAILAQRRKQAASSTWVDQRNWPTGSTQSSV